MKNKIKTITILTLILTIAIPLIATSTVNAAANHTKKTYSYIGATPNPVGVGQETLLHFGITDEMQDVRHGYEGLTITITKPDNTTETLGPFRTDSTGGAGTVYVPTMPGTYYLQTNFPAQWYNWTLYGGANIWFEASTSEKLALNVTEEPIPYYLTQPLPTEYWTRPIDVQLYDWYQISGSWISSPDNLIAPYNHGPETAHILWRTQLMSGGIVGGATDAYQFSVGGGGQSPWSSSVILGGVHIYNRYFYGGERNVVAVDLHTGEELWVRNNSAVSFGQQLQFDAANQHAAFTYWWEVSGTTWNAYDPFTGRFVWAMTNVPSGTTVIGPKGEFYRYVVNLQQGWIALWNQTAVVTAGLGGGWNPGRTYNATVSASNANVWAWNVSIPAGLQGSVRRFYYDDIMLGYYRGGTVLTRVEAGLTLDNPPFYAWAVSLKPESRGQLLWNKTYTLPPNNLTIVFGAASKEDRVWTIWCKETRSHTAYSLDTGEKLWGPTEAQHYIDTFGIPTVCGYFAYGKLYSTGYAGILYCYDAKTGKLLWTYEAKDRYNEILWGNNWPLKPTFFTDGKIYLTHGEHSPIAPLPRDAPFICLDAETGEEVWKINGAFRGAEWGGRAIIGDSTMVVWDSYDNYIYGVRKGPSAITVTVAPEVSVQGSSILVKGMVTDVSPGTDGVALKKRFPNGVPAVADECMSEWMLYVYKQFQRPANTTGVPVTLDVLDANGNYRNIGSVTSEASGTYSFAWTPDIPGKYTIIATFAGSNSYYPSYDVSYFNVDQASATPEPTSIPVSIADLYFVPAIAGIITAIAIVGAILVLLLLRKRP